MSTESVTEQLKISGYEILHKIGEGGYGSVFLATKEGTGEKVAIKLVEPRAQERKRIEREISNHSSLSHPNIVSFLDLVKAGSFLGLVMEYVSGGELFSYVLDNGRPGLPESVARKFFQELIRAVDYMHSRGIVSRDIKLENALLTGKTYPLLKICDFGFSKNDDESIPKSKVGTPQYIPPEVIVSERYDGKKADIWSCGVILYAMLSGQFPFQRLEDNELSCAQRFGAVSERILNCTYSFPPWFSTDSMDLLSKVLVFNPDQRMSLEDIQHHPFFVSDLPPGWHEETARLKAGPGSQRSITAEEITQVLGGENFEEQMEDSSSEEPELTAEEADLALEDELTRTRT
uniref:Sulfur stress regulator n=1 Tax=Tetraselmis sp. GSL018 TaxID=582737 RepID=A0A061RN07_9CHLO|mmetsp:Transcript_11093/g.26319  ORF Transcript_11093/g.26319 Transcript_11093/m.26319 type:complete len:347 (+) Transcript_11093:108-1148(+)|eukprot:CAMPEP_0177578874 /NCGR_PEP_ID=MMETSP0419_2-20121207/608_1 /TAXON_ID=582737 /ORGANISM="Tetraselmis sp., Strain GSL018" /LENGTH=346 /DNA_ID=CAMNT_0019067401 /DNA_START=57 /DNA_END=1097 /DNA_ORIENTATION=+